MQDLPHDPTQLEPARTSFLYDKSGQLVTPLMGAENGLSSPLTISPITIDAFIAIG